MNRNKNLLIDIIFIIALIGIFFFLDLGKIFFSYPQGIHFIRQTDSLSFVSQYFNTGCNFFSPRLFNLESIDGRGACEFPILYYITALLYSVFGEKVYLLKLLNITISYIGIFCVFKTSYLLLKDYFYASLIALFILTSTVFNYYSCNYLPDSSALGFIFIGWYYYFKFETNNKNKTIILSFLCFTLGGLIKVTYLINPISILLYYLVSIVLKKEKINKTFKPILICSVISILMVFFWNTYIIYYNSLYQSHYFTTSSRSIWSISSKKILVVWDYIQHYWYSKYFAYSSFHLIFFIIFFQIIFFKKSKFNIALITLCLFLGSLAYFLLFYMQFKNHDYYFMVFFPLIVFLMVNGISIGINCLKNKWIHFIIKLVMIAIVITGINYSRMKLNNRYENGLDDFSKIGFVIQNEIEEIEKLNIPKDSKFIVAPDLTPNGGLFFINKMGWRIDKSKNITIENINYYKKLGAEFLLLATNEKEVLEVGYNTGHIVFKGKELSIFKLNKHTNNSK